jgi:hypothetical protein
MFQWSRPQGQIRHFLTCGTPTLSHRGAARKRTGRAFQKILHVFFGQMREKSFDISANTVKFFKLMSDRNQIITGEEVPFSGF